MEKKSILKLLRLLIALALVTASVCIAQPLGPTSPPGGLTLPADLGRRDGQPDLGRGGPTTLIPDLGRHDGQPDLGRGGPPDHFRPDHIPPDRFRPDHRDHRPGYRPGDYLGGIGIVFGSWPVYTFGYPYPPPPPSLLNPPTELVVVSGYPCTIQWNDNSWNEAGFNIYVGGSCVNCAATNDWNLVASIGANVETYTWLGTYGESQYPVNCCDVGECSCVMVRAVGADGIESGNSNVAMLAPVC